MRDASRLPLSEAEREAVRAWAEGRPERAVRARIVLDADAGVPVTDSARSLGVSRPTVTAWRARYASGGLRGLEHRARSGRPPLVDEADAVAATLAGPPSPARTWSARALAGQLGISHTTLGAIWRRWGVDPAAVDTGLTLPTTPEYLCHRAELLGVWAGGGAAVLVVGEQSRSEPQGTLPAKAEERQAFHAALAAQLDRVRDIRTPGSDPDARGGGNRDTHPRLDTMLRALGDADPGRELHVIGWGDALPVGPAPDSPGPFVWHRAQPAAGWAGTVCAAALLELRRDPRGSRPALDSLVESARAQADGHGAPDAGGFVWQRPETGTVAAPTRMAPRAFNQFALGSFNEKLVIENIREAGSLSRVEIAEQTGLTPQAVSRITRNLLTSGFLVEDVRRPAGTGKPRVPLRLRPDAACAIGLHLDPETITQVVVDLCGNVLDRRQLALRERRDPAWCIERMAQLVAAAYEATRPVSDALLGVGVAVPGPLDMNAGVILDPPLFEAWQEVPLQAELAERLGMSVIVEKDATAAAVGERWLGAAERAGDFVYLYLGTGAGSGAFLNGDIYRGATGNAGEFGELCALALGRLTEEGGPQMVAECAPISAVVDKAAAAGLAVPGGDGAFGWVCAEAARGDERAVAAVRDVARVVARGAVGMTDLYDVDLLIVGGPAVPPQLAGIYLAEIGHAVNRFPVARNVREVQVEYSKLNEAAAAVGAASSVFHSAFAPRLRTHARAAVGGTATGR